MDYAIGVQSNMVIKETHVFTKIIKELIPDDLYQEFQEFLVKDPNAGDLIKGSGGLRKIRWNLPGQGKRGGIRVIYYRFMTDSEILMVYAYPKNKQDNLTNAQSKLLKQIVEEELNDE
jgi:hypothetical protein